MSKAKTETQTQTPTANGIIKGRPGKGRVLSLGQRAYCYATPRHKMTPENTFRYTAKRAEGAPKPVEREWCKKCRAVSRKASAVARRMREAKEEKARQLEVKAQLQQAVPKARKGAKAKATAKTPTAAALAKRKAAKAATAAASRKRAA